MRNALTSRPIQSKIYADYVQSMDALFIELPPFQRHRQDYLDDELFRSLQLELLKAPEAGDLIEGTGGLRKIRFVDERRHKGKRGGIRVIYYWWSGGAQFWLFTLYAKNEQNDLTSHQKKLLKQLLNREVEARTHHET
ncbi:MULTISPECIES: toxin [Pseudomonas]|uniref:toxin n=1 Tax=Pseudomonas TaxID=286 RepID=UPI000C88341F|nr:MULTISPECIES: toxin [Pseudomonas]PMY39821.1 toxin [Pseudomonas sp. FW306-2-2C-D06C]PYC39354.1 toxin [Pseudomonas chlororaphis]